MDVLWERIANARVRGLLVWWDRGEIVELSLIEWETYDRVHGLVDIVGTPLVFLRTG